LKDVGDVNAGGQLTTAVPAAPRVRAIV